MSTDRMVDTRSALWLSALVLVAVLSHVSGAARAAPDTSSPAFTIRLDQGLAPLIAGKRVGTLPQAIRIVGRPATIATLPGAPMCRAIWPRLKLSIDFSRPPAAICAVRSLGPWVTMTATGPRWHTTTGLHVGDTAARLHTLYPAARMLDVPGHSPVWQLETGGPLCDGGSPLSLDAILSADHVRALTVPHTPACG
jgi:hypothetical protein